MDGMKLGAMRLNFVCFASICAVSTLFTGSKAYADVCVLNATGSEVFVEIENWKSTQARFLRNDEQFCYRGEETIWITVDNGPEKISPCRLRATTGELKTLSSYDEFVGCSWETGPLSEETSFNSVEFTAQ